MGISMSIKSKGVDPFKKNLKYFNLPLDPTMKLAYLSQTHVMTFVL